MFPVTVISFLEKRQILFLEMTGEHQRFPTAESQGGLMVGLLHPSSPHFGNKCLQDSPVQQTLWS